MQKTLTNAFRFCLPPGMEKYWEGRRKGEEGEQHKGGTGSASVLGIKLNFFIGIFKCASASAPVLKATGRLAIWNIRLGYIPKSAQIFPDTCIYICIYIYLHIYLYLECSLQSSLLSLPTSPLPALALYRVWQSQAQLLAHTRLLRICRGRYKGREGRGEGAGCYGGWTAKAISSNKW